MPFGRQRQWRLQNQHQALLEYGLLKHACPEGIYLSLTPGNFSLWSGVIFVRKGPYSPAVLRFQVALPQQYPDVPPLILFTSDIFHPLITPLTTYTYTTGSAATDTVSATDDDRLLPGGLSLRHGFPKWFKGGESTVSTSPMFQDIDSSKQERGRSSSLHGEEESKKSQGHVRKPLSFHIPPPKEDGFSADDVSPSIVEVLYYLKRVFEDEALLDALPSEVAANPGAWHAWRAHRKPKLPKSHLDHVEGHARSSSTGLNSPGRMKPSGDWNWDGVWAERVKRGVNASLSDQMLYGSVDGDDIIHFLETEDETLQDAREAISLKDSDIKL